ncbi:TonB-dependent receptor [Niveispirillum fermenti]|uniref:TonB-dependent receptor n=1 Tax=Niveispirillum fermenti TaxID=1233113 RepID=UPI003A8B65BA
MKLFEMKDRAHRTSLRRGVAALLAAGTALAGMPALAQADMGTGSAAGSGDYVLEEITVTARKRAESLVEVPEAITAFDERRIETAGLRSLGEFSAMTPNININAGSGAGYPNIMVRGLAQAQGGEAPIAVVVDGVQISQPAFINRDYGDVAQVEVLRGPQGSLYGRNAIGGAINITTKQPTNELSGMVKASYGVADTVTLDASLSGPIVEDKVLFRLAGSYKDTDGRITNQTSGLKADYGESSFASGRLIFNLSEDWTLDLRGSYGKDKLGGLSAEVVNTADWNDFKPGYFVNDPRQSDEREIWDVSAKLDFEGDYLSFSSITGFSKLDELQKGDADFMAAPMLLQHVELGVEAFTQEVRLSSPSNDRFRWLVGAFYQNRDTTNFLDIPFDDGTGNPAPGPLAVSSHDVGTSKSWAGFGSASYDILPSLELTVGARYDEDKRTSIDEVFANSDVASTFTSFQPKVQMAWKPSRDLNLYATYGEGFGSGGFNAYIAGPSARRYDAQTAKNYEVGLKGAVLGGTVTYGASLFQVDYDNQQLFFIIANPPSQNIVNIDQTRVRGAELELTVRPAEGLQIAAGLGLTDPEIRAFALDPSAVGNRTPQATKYTFNLNGDYTMPLTADLDLRAYAGYRRQSSVYWDAANSLRTGPKDFVDLRLFLDTESWSAGVFAKNIGNTQYPTQAAAHALGPDMHLRIPSTRGVYGVEASYRF